MTDPNNDERTVRCPVEGCNAEKLARGIHLHVRQSSGDGHGPQGETPDHINLDDLETVGEQRVKMDYPEERETDTTARLCPYCSQTFAGAQGLMIHLGQMAGRENHPSDPKDLHKPSDFPRVEVDADGNVLQTGDAVESKSTDNTGKATVPTAKVFQLIANLVADGEMQTAQRVRRALLGDESESQSLEDNTAHWGLFHELVTQAQMDQPDTSVSAVIEKEGIMVACRGESAFYTAGEARDVAAGLERATSDDYPHEEITDLIEFLRYGADILRDGYVARASRRVH